MSFQITKITPFAKYPCGKDHAFSRGLADNYEPVVILQGFTDDHLHAPIEWQGRYFKPLCRHDDPKLDQQPIDVTVLLDDPKNPYKSGPLDKYDGDTRLYEKCVQVQRRRLDKPLLVGTKWELFAEKELILHQLVGNGPQTLKIALRGVLAWKSGDGSEAMTEGRPFAVKAIELTEKEINLHKYGMDHKGQIKTTPRPQKILL